MLSRKIVLPRPPRSWLIAVAVGAAALAAPAPAAAPVRATPDVLVVGDSLARGLTPYLAADLGEPVAWDIRAGRPTPDGLHGLRAALAGLHPRAVVLSLGTNDSENALRFAWRVREALAMVPPSSCVVWSTVYRPHRKGRFAGLNHVLRVAARRDPRLVLVDWEAAVARGIVPLRPDGLHPLGAGYRYRSLLFAAAVRGGCPALGGLAVPRI
jgi:hypothetical protein